MLVAKNNERERIYPTPKTEAECPRCNEKVISKCGKIKSWHWAHSSDSKCKSKGMSKWHSEWQKEFPIGSVEVRKTLDDGSFKIADVLIDNNVLEFQHSSINEDEVLCRNKFYGDNFNKNVVWVFDMTENSTKYNFSHGYVYKTNEQGEDRKENCFMWRKPILSRLPRDTFIFFDFGTYILRIIHFEIKKESYYWNGNQTYRNMVYGWYKGCTRAEFIKAYS